MEELYICNEFDRPCARLLCERTGNSYGRYLVSGEFCGMSDPTPLALFGVKVHMTNDIRKLKIVPVDLSAATYKNGRPRLWQPTTERGEAIEFNDYLTPWKRQHMLKWFTCTLLMAGHEVTEKDIDRIDALLQLAEDGASVDATAKRITAWYAH